MAEQYFPFDPDTRTPCRMPPANACDCQFHVLGSRDRYTPQPNAAYEMPTATWEASVCMHKALGITRGVIVQPTTYGLDHSPTLDALAVAGPNYKGCAIGALLIEPGNDKYIQKLADAGVGGARFNFLKQLNMMPSPREFERVVDRIHELGWYAKIQPGPEGILDSAPLYENIASIPIVIDHMGRPDISLGLDSPSVQKVLELLKKGNFWIMLSNGYKISKKGKPWSDTRPIARAYIEVAPERVLWATDWPHPIAKKSPPNDADILELFYSYTESDAEVEQILVKNPEKLFGF